MSTTNTEQTDTAFEKIFKSLMLNVHTVLPGVVVSFDPSIPTAKVQPALQRVFSVTGEPVDLPPCLDVPVVFPGSGDFWLTVDLKPGSYVLLAFSERSIENWKEQGGVLDPEINRTFNLSDAFAIAGVLPVAEKLTADVESDCISLRKKDNSVHVKVEDSKITCQVANALGVGSKFEIEASGVKAKPLGVLPITSEVTAYAAAPVPGYVEVTKHTHSVTGAVTGPPVPTIPGPP
jgi:hypothetical protein